MVQGDLSSNVLTPTPRKGAVNSQQALLYTITYTLSVDRTTKDTPKSLITSFQVLQMYPSSLLI